MSVHVERKKEKRAMDLLLLLEAIVSEVYQIKKQWVICLYYL